MAHATPDDLDASKGATTIEGDIENDSNPHGGVDKSVEHGRISRRRREQRTQRSRRPVLQGGQTHAQQLRILERQPDVPDVLQAGGVHREGRNRNKQRRRRAAMARASKKHIGPGAQGKNSGGGSASEIAKEKLPENMILSNRDKSRHPHQRGRDGKEIQTEQYQDHAANRLPPEVE
jgi:hypothetical protein